MFASLCRTSGSLSELAICVKSAALQVIVIILSSELNVIHAEALSDDGEDNDEESLVSESDNLTVEA